MSEFRVIPSRESIEMAPSAHRRGASEPEQEMNCFIDSMTTLIGRSASESLAELWLNELACMECAPGWEGFNWRSVSLSASAKLASLLISSQFSGPHF